MNDKVGYAEFLQKRINEKEAELRALWAELANVCREKPKPATAEEVAGYMNKLSCRGVFHAHGSQCLALLPTFANDVMFIAFGRMQEAVGEIAYFRQGYDGIAGLSFTLSFGKTWDEVLAALKAKEEYIRAAMRLGE